MLANHIKQKRPVQLSFPISMEIASLHKTILLLCTTSKLHTILSNMQPELRYDPIWQALELHLHHPYQIINTINFQITSCNHIGKSKYESWYADSGKSVLKQQSFFTSMLPFGE